MFQKGFPRVCNFPRVQGTPLGFAISLGFVGGGGGGIYLFCKVTPKGLPYPSGMWGFTSFDTVRNIPTRPVLGGSHSLRNGDENCNENRNEGSQPSFTMRTGPVLTYWEGSRSHDKKIKK
jgi:hypothetical protein